MPSFSGWHFYFKEEEQKKIADWGIVVSHFHREFSLSIYQLHILAMHQEIHQRPNVCPGILENMLSKMLEYNKELS